MNRLYKFSSVFGENWVVGRHLLPELRKLGKDERGIMLDLACGKSPFRDFFPDVEAYLRVDRDPADDSVVCGDMLSIPLSSHSVDLVLLSQAISDVPEPIEALNEVHRVLRPGGILLIFESMCYPEHDAPYDFYRIMPAGLRHLASATGFDFCSCKPLGGLFSRFSLLWNTFVMGALNQYPLLRPFGKMGVFGANIICYLLDRLFPHPRLASDYIATLQRSETVASDSCKALGST